MQNLNFFFKRVCLGDLQRCLNVNLLLPLLGVRGLHDQGDMGDK